MDAQKVVFLVVAVLVDQIVKAAVAEDVTAVVMVDVVEVVMVDVLVVTVAAKVVVVGVALACAQGLVPLTAIRHAENLPVIMGALEPAIQHAALDAEALAKPVASPLVLENA